MQINLPPNQNYDLSISCDYFVSMSEKSLAEKPIERGIFLGIQNGKIVDVLPLNQIPSSIFSKSNQHIDATGKAVIPGLINSHAHLPMTLLKGLADDVPFHDWLHNTIFPVEAQLVSRDFVRVGTQLAALELIAAGCTFVADTYYYEDEICKVLDEAGLRGIAAEAVLDYPQPDDKNLDGTNYKILDEVLFQYKNHGRIIPAIGPHAPYTCSDETLIKARDYAIQHGIPLMIHVSETEGEVKNSLEQYKETPVERLHRLGLTGLHHKGSRSIFAHCVQLSSNDIRILAETQSTVVYNPESNMKLGSGIAPIAQLLKEGVPVCLGTDGSASNNDINLFKEMDVAAKLQKLSCHDNTAMTALQSLKLTTIGAAKALGVDSKVGSLEVGKLADFSIINLNLPHMQPIHNLMSQLVYSANGSEVETVVCNGEIIYFEKQFRTLNVSKIYKEAEQFRDKIAEIL